MESYLFRGLPQGLVAILALQVLFISYSYAQLSAPVVSNDHVSIDGNKFLQNQADLDKHSSTLREVEEHDVCPQNVELKWMTEVSSSIYATPLITDLYSDGRKDIVVPSFVHYLEVLEGADGAQAVGWPAFHKSTVHTSPMLYDIDFDGVRDILVATYDGEVIFFKDTGERMSEQLSIPRLKVRKHWYVGLDPDPIDHSHPDVGAGSSKPAGAKRAGGGSGSSAGGRVVKGGSSSSGAGKSPSLPASAGAGSSSSSNSSSSQSVSEVSEAMLQQLKDYRKKMEDYKNKYGDAALRQLMSETRQRNPRFYRLLMQQLVAEGLVDKDGHVKLPGPDGASASTSGASASGGAGGRRRLMSVGDEEGVSAWPRRRLMQADSSIAAGVGVEKDPNTPLLSDEAADSFDVFNDEPLDHETQREINRQVDMARHQAAAGVHFRDVETGAPTGDGGDAGGDGGDAAGGDDAMERPKPRLEYDEFGDAFRAYDTMDETPEEFDVATQELLNSIPSVEDMHELDPEHYQHMYLGDYADRIAAGEDDLLGKWWEEEEFEQAAHQQEEQYVYIDAHVLANPNIADIDGDGHEELVVAVSYFYDREYYDQPEHAHELGDLDIGRYIASGLVCFDLRTRQLKWQVHMDLSTDTTDFKAYAYAAPTLVDMDRDGFMEIVVGTSMGFLYVMDHKGQPRKGWPIQMGEIQGQPLVMDFNSDGQVEVFAADTRGNIAAFSLDGEELWSRHVGSLVAQGATAGDINNDGELELVFGTTSGHIYAVSGSSGLDIKNFPFRTHGGIQAPVLITRLSDGPQQHVITMSFDGFLYLVDGMSGCADSVDLGETSYSMVLAEDLDNNGRLDLLVTTMNGNVYCFETPSEYHPLKAWPAQVLGPNGMVARHDLVGVYATEASRRPRDVAGDRLQVQIRLVDKRGIFAPNGTLTAAKSGPYNISVVLKGVGTKEMRSGSQPVIGMADTVAEPGVYTLEVPCPRSRSTATIHVEMADAHGLTLTDEFSLSFHLHFHKLLKWLVAGPLALMVVILLSMKRSDEEEEELRGALLPVSASRPHSDHSA